mgnify:CR=1 FL=1
MKVSCRLLAALIFAGSALLASDLTITFQTKGKGVLFKAAGGVEVEYHSEGFLLTRNVSTKQDTLVDYAKGITYTIDHKKQTIGMLKLEDALAAMESMGAQPEGMAGFMGAMFGDPNDVSVEKDGTEVVAERLCNRHLIRVAKLKAELYADPKLKLPVQDAVWAKHMKARAAATAAAGAMATAFKRLYEEMSKVKGVVLKSVIGGGMMPTMERTATEVSTATVDPALFKLPEGYKVEDLGKKMREEMAKAGR